MHAGAAGLPTRHGALPPERLSLRCVASWHSTPTHSAQLCCLFAISVALFFVAFKLLHATGKGSGLTVLTKAAALSSDPRRVPSAAKEREFFSALGSFNAKRERYGLGLHGVNGVVTGCDPTQY